MAADFGGHHTRRECPHRRLWRCFRRSRRLSNHLRPELLQPTQLPHPGATPGFYPCPPMPDNNPLPIGQHPSLCRKQRSTREEASASAIGGSHRKSTSTITSGRVSQAHPCWSWEGSRFLRKRGCREPDRAPAWPVCLSATPYGIPYTALGSPGTRKESARKKNARAANPGAPTLGDNKAAPTA